MVTFNTAPSSAPPPTSIPETTAIDAVFEKLLADIVRGLHPTGTRLPAERELARQLGASRPTLREALRRLGEWKLVEPRRGAAKAEASRGREHGQEHHDRDHPRHRAGDPPFGEQAPLRGAELAHAALHVSARLGGWRSAPVGSAIWPRSSRSISAPETSVSR